MYDCESIFDLLNSMPSKDRWKNYVRNKIETYWRQKILKMAKGKSTLCFLHPMSMKVGSVHNVEFKRSNIDSQSYIVNVSFT
jgi:hypothetical protein